MATLTEHIICNATSDQCAAYVIHAMRRAHDKAENLLLELQHRLAENAHAVDIWCMPEHELRMKMVPCHPLLGKHAIPHGPGNFKTNARIVVSWDGLNIPTHQSPSLPIIFANTSAPMRQFTYSSYLKFMTRISDVISTFCNDKAIHCQEFSFGGGPYRFKIYHPGDFEINLYICFASFADNRRLYRLFPDRNMIAIDDPSSDLKFDAEMMQDGVLYRFFFVLYAYVKKMDWDINLDKLFDVFTTVFREYDRQRLLHFLAGQGYFSLWNHFWRAEYSVLHMSPFGPSPETFQRRDAFKNEIYDLYKFLSPTQSNTHMPCPTTPTTHPHIVDLNAVDTHYADTTIGTCTTSSSSDPPSRSGIIDDEPQFVARLASRSNPFDLSISSDDSVSMIDLADIDIQNTSGNDCVSWIEHTMQSARGGAAQLLNDLQVELAANLSALDPWRLANHPLRTKIEPFHPLFANHATPIGNGKFEFNALIVLSWDNLIISLDQQAVFPLCFSNESKNIKCKLSESPVAHMLLCILHVVTGFTQDMNPKYPSFVHQHAPGHSKLILANMDINLYTCFQSCNDSHPKYQVFGSDIEIKKLYANSSTTLTAMKTLMEHEGFAKFFFTLYVYIKKTRPTIALDYLIDKLATIFRTFDSSRISNFFTEGDGFRSMWIHFWNSVYPYQLFWHWDIPGETMRSSRTFDMIMRDILTFVAPAQPNARRAPQHQSVQHSNAIDLNGFESRNMFTTTTTTSTSSTISAPAISTPQPIVIDVEQCTAPLPTPGSPIIDLTYVPDDSAPVTNGVCMFCCEQSMDVIFACGEEAHRFVCRSCVTEDVKRRIKKCPICRKPGFFITRIIDQGMI